MFFLKVFKLKRCRDHAVLRSKSDLHKEVILSSLCSPATAPLKRCLGPLPAAVFSMHLTVTPPWSYWHAVSPPHLFALPLGPDNINVCFADFKMMPGERNCGILHQLAHGNRLAVIPGFTNRLIYAKIDLVLVCFHVFFFFIICRHLVTSLDKKKYWNKVLVFGVTGFIRTIFIQCLCD